MSESASTPMTQAEYLAGRWKIGEQRRRLRYEAGIDLCLAALRILKEYAADCESEHFVAVHDEDLPKVRALIEKGERIERNEEPYPLDDNFGPGDLPQWRMWLREVADLVPFLWD